MRNEYMTHTHNKYHSTNVYLFNRLNYRKKKNENQSNMGQSHQQARTSLKYHHCLHHCHHHHLQQKQRNHIINRCAQNLIFHTSLGEKCTNHHV